MPWLKLLHIAALVIWCGALLYLPALLLQALQLRKDAGFAQGTPPMPRFFITPLLPRRHSLRLPQARCYFCCMAC